LSNLPVNVLNHGIASATVIKLIRKAVKPNKYDSSRNLKNKPERVAPIVFLTAISFARLAANALDRLM
jgi:hypothetical protein